MVFLLFFQEILNWKDVSNNSFSVAFSFCQFPVWSCKQIWSCFESVYGLYYLCLFLMLEVTG